MKCSPGEPNKCGKNAQCDPKTGFCICNSDSQDFPHCCFPSCNIDGKCVNRKCQCIGEGKYPKCQEACTDDCKEEEQCIKVIFYYQLKKIGKNNLFLVRLVEDSNVAADEIISWSMESARNAAKEQLQQEMELIQQYRKLS